MSGRTGTEPAATAEVEARRLLARGVAAGIDGRLTTAIEDLERALAILGLSPRGRVVGRGDNFPGPPERIVLVARILVSLAFPQHELGRDAIASRALDDAERLLRSWPNDELTVLIHAQRGAILLREGRITEAVAQLDQAVELLDNAAPEDQCKILINRGELHTMLGNIPAARADTERALRLAEKHQIATLAFGATHNLGMQEYFAGRLPSALAQIPPMDAARTDFERGVVGMDRSKVLLSAGLVSEADQALVDACAALSRTEMVQFLAEAELTRAEVALLADDPQLAQRVSQAAIDRLRPRSNRRAIALGELVKLKADAAAGAPRGAVVRTADRLAGVLAELGLPDHARLARLIAIDCSITARGTTPLDPRRARNDTRERAIRPARETTPRPLPAISPTQPLELRLYGRLVRTRLAFARGDRRSGLRQARAGMLDLTNYEAQFGSLDLQTSSAVRGVSLAAAVVAQEIAADRPTSVLTWLERARAISGRVVPLQPPEDDVTAQLLAQLRWVTNQIDDPATSARAADDLRRRRTALESQIRSRSWTVQGQAPMAAEPRVSDLRRALGSAVLVAIFTLHEQLFGIALTARRCWLRPLGALTEVQELSRRVGADLDVLALDQRPRAAACLGPRLAAPRPRPPGHAAVGPVAAARCAGGPAASGSARVVDLGRAAELPAAAVGDRAVGQHLAECARPVRGRAGAGGGDRRARTAARRGRGRRRISGVARLPDVGRPRSPGGALPGGDQRRPARARRRTRPAPAAEPAVLLDPVGRRTGRRLRPGPRSRSAPTGRALGV